MQKKSPENNIYQYFDMDKMHQHALNLWKDCSGEGFSGAIREYDDNEKEENQQAILHLIEKIEVSKTKDKLKKVLKEFLLQGPLLSRNGKEIFKDPGFFISTETFLTKVRKYDSEITKEDIGQAFRNVWIMNLLQKTFKIPVVCTDAVFGYSMLYPYTDNFMDDSKIKREEKYLVCERIHQRLSGYVETAKGKEEEKIFDMIEKIEENFSRDEYPEVFESLLYIQHSQRESLRQQSSAILDKISESKLKTDSQEKELQEKNLFEITIHKGGSSVLADGFLVKGSLSQQERIYCFNYGVLLQMADDLQDCKEDYENRHLTIFSTDYGKKILDDKTNQLIRFAEKVYENYFKGKNDDTMKNLLMENTLLLILGSVLMNPSCFSEDYIQWARMHFPVRQGFLEFQQQILKEKLII